LILDELAHGPAQITELAERLGREKKPVEWALWRLVRNGHVQQAVDERNRRRRIYSLPDHAHGVTRRT